MDFRKVIYENVKKKKISFHNKHIYIYGSQTFYLKFYFACIVKVCFVLRKQSLCLLPLYMDKTIPTLGNEKEQ